MFRIILFVIVVFLIACKEEEKDIPTVSFHEGYDVLISLPAGESIEDSKVPFLPAPFNMATFKGQANNLRAIIISDRLGKNKQIKILPVAFLSTSTGMLQDRYVIAVPADTTLRTVAISDFSDFSVNHYGIRNMVENWFKYKNENERSLQVQWSSEQTAIEQILKNEKIGKN